MHGSPAKAHVTASHLRVHLVARLEGQEVTAVSNAQMTETFAAGEDCAREAFGVAEPLTKLGRAVLVF